MTYQSGRDVDVRQTFLSNGSLTGTQDTNYRAISDNWPVFAYANNLGTVGSSPVATLYTIVHSQERAIYFNGASGLVGVPSLWTSYWSNDLAAVCSLLMELRLMLLMCLGRILLQWLGYSDWFLRRQVCCRFLSCWWTGLFDYHISLGSSSFRCRSALRNSRQTVLLLEGDQLWW